MPDLKLDIINVVDVESTCWSGEPPMGQQSEIIEIGVAQLNIQSLEVITKSPFGVFVHPQLSEVTPYCTSLTGIKPEDLKDAGSFRAAVDVLNKEFRTSKRVWASWGDYDRKMFERCCSVYEVKYPFTQRHINVKTLYALLAAQGDNPKECGLDVAVTELGWAFEGRHHRGGDDAINVAKVLVWILERGRRRNITGVSF